MSLHSLPPILKGHAGRIYQAVFIDNTKVITASGDNTAGLWDVDRANIPIFLEGHTDLVSNATFSLNRKFLLTCSFDATARLWDANTLAQLVVLNCGGGVEGISFSPDSRQILTVGGGSVIIWSSETHSKIAEGKFPNSSESGSYIGVFHPDGTSVVTGSEVRIARLWNAKNLRSIAKLEHTEPHPRDTIVDDAAFSADGKYVVTACYDTTARLWDASRGTPLHVFKHDGGVFAVSFSPDGKRIVTACSDRTARIWDTQNGQLLRQLKGHENQVSRAVFSPDGTLVATGSDDYTARLWHASTGEEIRIFKGHEDRLSSVSFSPNGKQVLTSSWDTTARIWNVA